MFETERSPDTPTGWDQTMDRDPGPCLPGWRHTWFRRHRSQPSPTARPSASQLPAP